MMELEYKDLRSNFSDRYPKLLPIHENIQCFRNKIINGLNNDT